MPPPTAAARAYAAALVAVLDADRAQLVAVLRDVGLVDDTRADAAADGSSGPTATPEQLARVQRELDEIRHRIAKGHPPFGAIDTCAANVSRTSRAQWRAQLAKLGISLDAVADANLTALRAHWRAVNVDLIRSVREEQLARVRELLTNGTGERVETLARSIREAFDVSDSRAELIARDQTLKLNGQIARERHVAAGITEYVWRTSRDERVRSRHKALDGTRHRYTAPPVVDLRTGRRANPGEDYQCRCTADPVIPGLLR